MTATIFECLGEIDKGNVRYYHTLSQAERTALIKPIVLQGWLVSSTPCSNVNQHDMYNENVNQYIFSLYKHPSLLFKLMCGCGQGRPRKYSYTKRVGNGSKQPLSLNVIKMYEGCSERDAICFLRVYNVEDIMEMAIYVGFEKTELTAIKKEWKNE